MATSNPGKWNTSPADHEVDQLLRAAHDDVLLNLNVSSHIARASDSAIDPDLDRRFDALRRKPTTTKVVPPKSDAGEAAEDDLFARFAALKNSLPSHNKSGNQHGDVLTNEEVEGESEEDEVEKVIQWAIDAARLDASPPSDDDDEEDDGDGEEEEEEGNNRKVRKK